MIDNFETQPRARLMYSDVWISMESYMSPANMLFVQKSTLFEK